MKNKSYLKTRRKKSFASIVLALLLMLSFNASPLMFLSNAIRNASAYKSSQTQTYYSNTTNDTEKKFNDANYPSSLKDYFNGSDKNFNIFSFYNTQFDLILKEKADSFFKVYDGEVDGVKKYQEFYIAFMRNFGISSEKVSDFYAAQKDGDFLKLNLETITFTNFIERLGTKGFEKYDDAKTQSIPALSQVAGAFKNLSNFYRLFANHVTGDAIDMDDDKSPNNQITTTEAFYNSNTHYLRLKKYIDERVAEKAPSYAFDGKTQDTNIAAIFAENAPITVDYNYISNSYEKYSEPSANYRTTTVDGVTRNNIYYFGLESEISSLSAYDTYKGFFTIKAKNEKEDDDMLFYRLTQPGEIGYIDSNHPTYYRFTSKPYVTSSSYYTVYVLNNNPTQSQLDTYSSIYFKTMTLNEYNAESKFYVNIPYESDELYFKAVYGNLLYSKDGFSFEEFVNYFTTKKSDGSRTSSLYLKYTASEKKEVYIDSTKLSEFEEANPNYVYHINAVDFSSTEFNKRDYELIVKNSSNSAYFVEGFELYFMKVKEYYSDTTTNTYNGYETTKDPIVDLETQEVASTEYELDGSERKIFVVSDNATVTIGSKNYAGVSQATIDANPNFYVEAPAYIYNKYNIDNTYKLYYKHTTKTANKIYIVDDSDGASENNIYKTLNYNVIKSSELKDNYSNYLAIPESDANYNKNFQTYYKYKRTANPSAGKYILKTTGITVPSNTEYKSVGSGELTDFVLIDKNASAENQEIYNTAKSALSLTEESFEKLAIYYKLSDVFVQNELKGGNAVYIIDSSLSTSDKEEYSKNMYTAISQKEVDNNPDLYVLINEIDPNHSAKDGVKLYYKYKQSNTEKKIVYSIDGIDQKASDFDKKAYELITSGSDYKPGQELYYKKKLESSTENRITKNTYYYYQTSSTVTLSANSYYAISFYVQTIGENARASFGIKDTANILTDINLNNINTNGKWEQYYLFLSTDSATASTINLYLYLGDEEHGVAGNTSVPEVTGAVFFDDIKITKIGLSDFSKKALDDKEIYSTPYKEGEVEQEGKFADEYNNRVYVANTDSRFTNSNSTLENTFDFKKYIDSTIDVFGTNSWKDMFDFDQTSLQNILGRDNGTEEGKIQNILASTISSDIDGYNMYDSSFTSLWRYYISRDLKNEFSIEKYRKAYSDGKLDVSITNKIEQPEQKEENDKDDESKEDEKESDIKYVSSPFKKDNYVLKLKNTNKDINLGITSNSFKVKQFEYYKITLWIYSPDLEGKATVSVNSILKDRTTPVYGSLQSSSVSSVSANIENSSSKSSEFGWIPVTLYIEGNNYEDMDCYLVLTAEKDCTVYFDNIRIEKTTSAQFDTAQSNSSSEKYTCALSLTPSSSLYSSDVKNGTFDYIKESSIDHDVTSKVPYSADNWTGLSDNSSRVIAGVVSTQQTAFFNEYSKDTNKIPTDSTDNFSNVYAIYSPATVKALDGTTDVAYKHKYSIYSGSLSMSANSVYKITFKFYKTDAFTGKMISNIYLSSVKNANIIASMQVDASDIESGWQTFTYYIATSTSSQTIYIEIGVKDANELCFFKNVTSKKLSGKTIDGIIASVAEENGVVSGSTEDIYNKIKNIRFLDMANTNFSYHSVNENENTNLFDQKIFSNKSELTPEHTVGQTGVAVATYFDTVNTTTYSVTIDKTTYYIGEVYTFSIGDATYYVHKTYDQQSNSFDYKLYSDKALTNEVTKIDGKDITIETTGSVVVKVGETNHSTTTTYRLYKFVDLREEVTSISGSAVTIENLNEVVVGTGSKAKKNTISTTQNSSYKYHFGSSAKEDYVLNNTIIPASELNNNQSSNVLILSNSYSTDYLILTQSSTKTLGTSTYNILRVYVKTSDFAKENFGLNIEIEAVNVKWTNINTTNSDKADENGFVCYEALIRSNSSDSISNFGVKLSLGDETNTGTGYAIISKISLESLSSVDAFEHYSSLVGDDNENIKKAIYENKSSSDDDKNEKNADDKNSVSWATFFYIFSSILLVVTMAVAMVALILKKHPIKSTQIFENDHDRDISTTQNKKSKSGSNKKEVVLGLETEKDKKEKSDGGII